MSASDGNHVDADQKLDGAPSVLYDAVVIFADSDGAQRLAELPPARDFVNDAFVHCTFVGYTDPTEALFEAVRLAAKLDGGLSALTAPARLRSCSTPARSCASGNAS